MISARKFNLYKHNPSRLIFNQPINYFSSDTLNFRVPLIHPTSHKLTDEFTYKYENKMFSAYLKKRKIPRSQIHPKIHIIDNVPESQQPHLSCQKLFPLKKSLDDQTMKRIVKQDPTHINSAYIMSLFIEDDNFKEMIDEYVGKVLVCGKAPGGGTSNDTSLIVSQTMDQIQQRVLELYHIYYFGQQLSPLQKQIQYYYLVSKQEKYLKKKIYPKNAFYRCIWRPEDQRLLEEIINWQQADLNLSDINNRQYYHPLMITQRLPYLQKMYTLIGGDSFLSKLMFRFKIKPNYTYSYTYLTHITQKLLDRLLVYIKCIQFTHMMRIPPDFTIQLSILHIHAWLLIDRLKKFNSKQSKNLAKLLEKAHANHINSVLSTLNIKKVVSTQKKFLEAAQLITSTLDLHFNNYEQSKKNPYYNIDALVWSIVFREKVERYGPEVYKFSEYLVKNYRHLKNFSEEDFINAVVQFDVFLNDPDYQKEITKINKPLAEQQFEEQFNSNKENKSYYYKFNQKDEIIKINPSKILDGQNYSFTSALIQKTVRFIKKYLLNTKNYDHFSEMEQQEKLRAREMKKSPWKNATDKIEDVDKEFVDLQRLRRKKRVQKGPQNDKK